jgi:hypothetical protein
MSTKGVLVLTNAEDFGKKYSRVKAVSPDRIPSRVRDIFAGKLRVTPDPAMWLKAIKI